MALNDIGAIVNAGPEDLVAHGGMAERAGFSQVTAAVVQIVPHAAELADAVQVGGRGRQSRGFLCIRFFV